MEKELKPIVTTVLGTIAFMFLALSTITILSSGRVFEGSAELAAEPAKESVLPALAAGGEPKAVLTEDTLAAVIERPPYEISAQTAR